MSYATACFLVGLFAFVIYPAFGVPFFFGAGSVAVGTLRARRSGFLPSALFLAGGVAVGGALGLVTAAWEYTEPGVLAVGFGIGVLFAGWPPIVVGAGRLVWPRLHLRWRMRADSSRGLVRYLGTHRWPVYVAPTVLVAALVVAAPWPRSIFTTSTAERVSRDVSKKTLATEVACNSLNNSGQFPVWYCSGKNPSCWVETKREKGIPALRRFSRDDRARVSTEVILRCWVDVARG
jgi:hypothetical protein